MATKAKGLKSLIGKQVKVQGRYSDNVEGPFKLLYVDPPYIELELNGEAFWWHMDVIEGIREDSTKDEA